MRRTFLFAVIMTLLSFSPFSWAEEATYRTHIKPIFEAKCAVCHGAGSPEHQEFKEDQKKFEGMMKGPRMDNYTHMIYFVGWPDTGAIMRRLDDGKNTKDGKPGNMYQYLGANEEERQKHLKLFKDWVGNWTLKRWKEVSKDEISGLKVKY